MKKLFRLFLTLNIVVALASSALAGPKIYPPFDRGPDLKDDMQQELVEIIQSLPFLPGISEKLQVLVPSGKGQKFRPDFGAMPIRGFLQPNSISVLIIGQDGTHIAEGANRPGIAGFGGRVQDMLVYFGILQGVAFTNLYVNTISGQYGSRSTPVVVDGQAVQYQNVIENRQWLLTHEGPYGEWRNKFLSWIIRNNLGSLKMVMMLGQAGKDAGSNLVNYLGGTVKARASVRDGSQLNVPIFKMASAGGNNEWAVPLTAIGEDVAEVLRQNPETKAVTAKELNDELQTVTAKLTPKLNSLKADLDQAQEDSQDESGTPATKAKALAKIRSVKKQIDETKGPIDIAQARVAALEKSFDYSDGDAETGEGVSTYDAELLLEENPQAAIHLMTFSRGGWNGNGVLYPQQFGGWDLSTMSVDGKNTRSIQGLHIPCTLPSGKKSNAGACRGQDYVTAPDIVFVGAPHPTALTMMNDPKKAAAAVEKELLAPLRTEMKRGWVPPQPELDEKGQVLPSPFLKVNAKGEPLEPYVYGRGVIPPSHGDPGITDMRLLPVSTAKRVGKSMIVIGTRGQAAFDPARLKAMEKDVPSNSALVQSHNVLTGRPKFSDWVAKYDRGPNEKYTKLLFEKLKNQKMQILWPKAEYSKQAAEVMKKALADIRAQKEADEKAAQAEAVAKKQSRTPKKVILDDDDRNEAYLEAVNAIYNTQGVGINGFNFKSHPEAGFFGHYRGTFENPRVFILADPSGYDSFITSKAMTGNRGQYLNGLMNDLGIGKDYLVLSTVPMMMDGATPQEWAGVLKATSSYRTDLVKAILADSKPQLILADGPNAAAELKRLGVKNFVEIQRTANPSQDMKVAGGAVANKVGVPFLHATINGERADIPREHLTWIARTWEGTSGDRVITADDEANKGKAYAIVAPNWARLSETYFTDQEQQSISELINRLAEHGEQLPQESVQDFVQRRQGCTTLAERSRPEPPRFIVNRAHCGLVSPVAYPGLLQDSGAY